MNSDKLKVFGGPNGHPKYKVFLTWDCQAVAEDETLPDFLGHYPIGSDCAKKFKKAGLPVYDK